MSLLELKDGDLVVDVAYVGNRGKGFTANNMLNLNGITPERLRSFGLDINNANDTKTFREKRRIGLAGWSLGGYYAPRAAAFPPQQHSRTTTTRRSMLNASRTLVSTPRLVAPPAITVRGADAAMMIIGPRAAFSAFDSWASRV